MRDTAWSLDTTPPLDYEPLGEPQIPYREMSLDAIGTRYKTDKSIIKHDYCRTYERYFAGFRLRPIFLLEIGVACGASLKMWSRFFAQGMIFGADIRPECAALCKSYDNIEIVIADATKQAIKAPAAYDIVIDDGSHVSADIVDSFILHWPLLEAGGFYCIEDTYCTHAEKYRTRLQVDEMRYARKHYADLIDEIMQMCDCGKDVDFVHHYRELTIIRKAPTC